MFSGLTVNPPVIEKIQTEWCAAIDFSVLRLDLVYPQLGGNKLFKLLPNIDVARRLGKKSLASFGGAYSNHLRALAAAGKIFDIKTVGFVRGEIITPLNPVLEFAVSQGMELIPVSRTAYRNKHTAAFLAQIRKNFNDPYIIPEGGSNLHGVRGCMEIAKFLLETADDKKRVVMLACGTGATMSGLIAGLHSRAASETRVIGIAVLKAPGYIEKQVQKFTEELTSGAAAYPVEWQVLDDFHCGGYGKTSVELNTFIDTWQASSHVPIEPVYTGKMFWAVKQLCENGFFAEGSEVVLIHTGGVYACQ
ncbi:MAG: pyridoxal-phosphate dependent enzyme [Gammaproteobacteria bacterium]|nr:pyridoxal-phosphate dependent enzyme [Gammaproteobacteria bacterium]